LEWLPEAQQDAAFGYENKKNMEQDVKIALVRFNGEIPKGKWVVVR
jgi:hypothetical protein